MTAKRRSETSRPNAAGESLPKDADTPFPLSREERMAAGRAKGLAKIKARGAENQARRAAGEKTPLELYRAGEYPIDQWSDDEVSQGRPANLFGTFSAPHPNFTGKQNAEIKRELLRRGEKMLHTYYFNALKVLEEVATNGESEPSRVKAANLMIERIAGRTVEKIEIKSSDPWADILEEVLEDEVLERMAEPEPEGR